MRLKTIYILFFLISAMPFHALAQTFSGSQPEITVQKTADFELTGDGTTENWDETDWINLTQRTNLDATSGNETKAKILYSNLGLYVFFQSEDSLVTTPFKKDYEELWLGDVVEVFLWPHKSDPDYFEYEISPLDYELPLIVSNIEGELLHWIPFENSYHKERKVRHKTTVTNGQKKNGTSIDVWTAEIFIPFKLLHPLKNIHPVSGTEWRANLYRIDYDYGETNWSWSAYEVNYHDYQNFGVLRFE